MKEIPEGHTAVEVIINADGTYTSKVIGHGKNASCMDNDDESILDKIMAGIGPVVDYGHTDEYYEEKKARKTTPMKHKEEEVGEESKKIKNKKIDMGFGV